MFSLIQLENCSRVNNSSMIRNGSDFAKRNVSKRSFHSSSKSYSNLPPPKQLPQRRVVVTGLGMISPLGVGVTLNWKRLNNSECGIKKIDRFDTSKSPVSIAGLVPEGSSPGEYDPKLLLAPADLGPTARFVRYATVASIEAINDSGWIPNDDHARTRTGVAIGSGIASMEDLEEGHNTFVNLGQKKLSPYFIPKILINTAAGHVSMKYGFKGPNHSVSTACATGAHAIGDAARFIMNGYADVMVAGSTEAAVTPLTLSGFARARALSTKFQDSPQAASRPFDKERDGFVMGEGAGIMVLEELEHALARKARIYAELRSYGLSGDAYHLTAPSPDGSGASRAMQMAIDHSGLRVQDIGYINAHATSTPLGDVVESRAIQNVFQDHANKLSISSTKGATGHLLGASGSVEAIYAILALHTSTIPPTINLTQVDPECTLDYTPNVCVQKEVQAVMTNSFGFGGVNASLIFSKPNS